jgi:hypothetical protein
MYYYIFVSQMFGIFLKYPTFKFQYQKMKNLKLTQPIA